MSCTDNSEILIFTKLLPSSKFLVLSYLNSLSVRLEPIEDVVF